MTRSIFLLIVLVGVLIVAVRFGTDPSCNTDDVCLEEARRLMEASEVRSRPMDRDQGAVDGSASLRRVPRLLERASAFSGLAIDQRVSLARAWLEVRRRTRDEASMDLATQRATTWFERALDLDPGRDDAVMGLVDAQRNNSRVALEIWQRAWRRAGRAQPVSGHFKVEIGRKLLELERVGEALPILDEVREGSANGTTRLVAQEMLARVYESRGQIVRATASMERAVAIADMLRQEGNDDVTGCAYQALGALYARQGNAARSLEYYVKGADIEYPLEAPSQLLASAQLFVAGDLERALVYAARALEIEEHKACRVWHAQMREAQGAAPKQDDEAVAERALLAAGALLSFDLFDGAQRLLETAWKRVDSDEARDIARRLVEHGKWPKDESGEPLRPARDPATAMAALRALSSPALLRRALVAFDRSHFDRAGRPLEILLAREDYGSRAIVLEGLMLLLEKRAGAARKCFERVSVSPGVATGARVGLAHIAIFDKRYEDARSLLALPGVLPDDAPAAPVVNASAEAYWSWIVYKMARYAQGWMLANQARHEEAITAFDAVLAGRPGDVLALLGRGTSRVWLGHLDQAEADFQRVLKQDGANAYAHAELALVELNRGDLDAARRGFERAKNIEGERYTCPYEGLGLVYLKQGRIGDAKRSFEKAIAINPDIEFKKYNELAKIHIADGALDKARALLEKSAANYPHDSEAKTLLEQLDSREPNAGR